MLENSYNTFKHFSTITAFKNSTLCTEGSEIYFPLLITVHLICFIVVVNL